MSSKILNEIEIGEIDFFYPLSQEEWNKLESLSHIELLEVIGKLNEQMVKSTELWEGG